MDLSQLIKQGPVDFDLIIDIAKWLFTALAELHLDDFAHRNISPSTILISGTKFSFAKNPYLIRTISSSADPYNSSHGRARESSSHGLVHALALRSSSAFPTSIYSAPELADFNPLRELTLQRLKMADVWSAALTIRALTDGAPDPGDDEKVIGVSYTSPVATMIAQGLASKPDRRWTAAQIRDAMIDL